MTTINPCPFCNYDDVEIDEVRPGEYAIDCPECECIGPIKPEIMEAIKCWNLAIPFDFSLKPAPELKATSSLEVPALNEGEIYLGAIIYGESAHRHHTILLPGDVENKTWKQAMKWAADQGGDLPNRVEQALLFATLKSEFQEAAYWSNSQHAVYSGCAWYQSFGNGSQYDDGTSNELRARAVRRLIIQ